MKFIFEQLSCLAHIKHNTQPSKFWLRLAILVTYSHYLAILLPQNGWNLWDYSNRDLKLFQVIAQSQLMIPLLIDSQFDFGKMAMMITYIFLLAMLGCSALLLYFRINNDSDQKNHFSIRILLFYFLILTTTVLQLPIIFLFLSQIFYGKGTLNYESAISSQSIINAFGLITFAFLTLAVQYFFRSYTIVPYSQFQQKFNGFSIANFVLSNVLGMLYFLHNNFSLSLSLIIVLHMLLICKIIEGIISKPFVPQIKQDHFILSIVVESLNIVVSINVFTENIYINENYLLIVALIVGTFAYFISSTIYKRNQVKIFDFEDQHYTSIPIAQELYFLYLLLNNDMTQSQFFFLFFHSKPHILNCINCQNTYRKKDQNIIQIIPKMIQCMLTALLEKIQIDSKYANEETQLLFINYMADQANKPLLAYVEIKKYQLLAKSQSYYFFIAQYQINNEIQDRILSKQSLINGKHNIILQQQTMQLLNIQSIATTTKFYEEFLLDIQRIILEKISFWTFQIRGFENINDLEKLAINQSSNIQDLRKKIEHFFNFDAFNIIDKILPSTNVLALKLISIFYSTILNDQNASKFCESIILQLFNEEKTYSEEIVTNLTLIQEKAVIVLLSMVKSRGKIVNQDQRLLAKYFGFDDQEFSQIENVAGLMPSFFSERHDRLLQNYLKTAKSIFFDDYKMIFSLSKERMLIPQQLKIDNDFSILEDYVLIGCLSEIKLSSDFVLFGDDGYLIGCTRNFYQTFLQSNNYKNSERIISPDKLSLINVFMLFPTILELLNQIKNQLEMAIGQRVHNNQFRIKKFENLSQIIEGAVRISTSKQQSQRCFELSINPAKLLEPPQDKISGFLEKIIENDSNQTSWSQIPLYSPILQHNFSENMKKFDSKDLFVCKAQLDFQQIGDKIQRKGYFILELNDIRKSEETEGTELVENDTKQLKQTFNNINMLAEQQMFPSNFPRIENVFPEPADEKTQNKGFDSNYIIQTAGSYFKQPLEYRPRMLHRNFTEMPLQLDGDIGENQVNDLKIQDHSPIISFSNERQQDTNNGLFHKAFENQLPQQQKQLTISPKRSKQSRHSGTQGTQANHMIKSFLQKTNCTWSLKMLISINAIVLITVMFYSIVHLIIIDGNINEFQQTITYITGPSLLNKYFCKAFCFIWSLVFNSLNIIDSSDYIIMQTIREIKDLAAIMNPSLQQLYSTFVGIEMAGLLNLIQLDLLYQKNQNVTYTYFINYISNVADYLFQVEFSNRNELKQLIDVKYFNNLLELRHNIKNASKMNAQLINSLNSIFINQQQSYLLDFQTQISIEIVILSLIMLLQIYYWSQLGKYKQQILLLSGRLKESQAQEQIVRFEFINETLKIMTGWRSWRQQDFYQLSYSPLRQLGIESVRTESRILREYSQQYQSKRSLSTTPAYEENGGKKQKKSDKITLNSRINKINISILSAVFIVMTVLLIFIAYIIGGYLIYRQQQNDLYPTSQLTLNFIRFTQQQDITVSGALIAKSELLLNEKLIEMKFYTPKQMLKFLGSNSTIKLFIGYYQSYYSNLTEIYQYIIESDQIPGGFEQTLMNLYQNNFCITLPDIIPFCNLDNTFNATYGVYSENDDNREYLSTGIQGVVSRMDALFKSNFQYEIASANYQNNMTLALSSLNTKEFTNAIFEHFIDTSEGTTLFMNSLIQILQNLLIQDLNEMQSYYIGASISLISIYMVVFGIWLHQTNLRLIKLRLILTNLPLEILTNSYTLSLLKRLK